MGAGYDKLKALLDSANSKMGTSYTKFSDAVNRLISGYGSGSGTAPSGTKSITANGTYDVSAYASANVNVPDPHSFKAKNITANGTYNASSDSVSGFSSVTVNVPSSCSHTFKEKSITQNGTYTATNDSVSGYSRVVVNVPATTPNLESNKTVTPSTTQQTVTPTSGYDGLAKVTVNAIPSQYIVPSGSLDVTENGSFDVTNKKTVNVNVPTSSGSGGLNTLKFEKSITYGTTQTSDIVVFDSTELGGISTADYDFIFMLKLTSTNHTTKQVLFSGCDTLGGFGYSSTTKRYGICVYHNTYTTTASTLYRNGTVASASVAGSFYYSNTGANFSIKFSCTSSYGLNGTYLATVFAIPK